jgi:6-phosphogluconolactonase
MPPGSGPRHLVVDGSVAYVIGELASSVTVCDVTGLSLDPRASVPLRAPDARGENTAAEVVVAGEQVLGSNRGDDTVTVLVRDGASLRRSEILPCGGSWPRWMGLVDGQLLVANERSDGLARLRPDGDGWAVVDVLDWPAPTGCAVLP